MNVILFSDGSQQRDYLPFPMFVRYISASLACTTPSYSMCFFTYQIFFIWPTWGDFSSLNKCKKHIHYTFCMPVNVIHVFQGLTNFLSVFSLDRSPMWSVLASLLTASTWSPGQWTASSRCGTSPPARSERYHTHACAHTGASWWWTNKWKWNKMWARLLLN